MSTITGAHYGYLETPGDQKQPTLLLVLPNDVTQILNKIAELVVEWAFHAPKVVYAALLYELVRHTCLPLSYIKEHYNLGVYAFVLNVVKIDKHQDLDHPSLLHVKNRLEAVIKEKQVQLAVLFIKLAERLYALRHAAGYIHLTEVQHMAQETLAIDIKIANTYANGVNLSGHFLKTILKI